MVKYKTLSMSVAAERLCISVSTMYRLKDTGQIKCIHMGASKGLRVSEKEIMFAKRYGFRPEEPE